MKTLFDMKLCSKYCKFNMTTDVMSSHLGLLESWKLAAAGAIIFLSSILGLCGGREETIDMCRVHEQALEQRPFQGLHARYGRKVKGDSRVFLDRANPNSNVKLDRMSDCEIKVCG